jgi:hypothetical protein
MVKYVTDPLELRERYDGTFWEMEEDFTLDVEEDEVVVAALGFLGVAVLVDVAGVVVVTEDDSSVSLCCVGEAVFMLATTFVAVGVVAAVVVLSPVVAVASFSVAASGSFLGSTVRAGEVDCSESAFFMFYSNVSKYRVKRRQHG